ncbi:hypothetical protein GGTG_03703 [Gaeumannomyces tritici R3-111a-1]|uniref:6-phosphogluconate dehydrogenase n=1 Tax=Gaeumannomyces tritici (strain R3-111a-1) TaxID=644352 RepID=J3NQZ8_GAET3|nr:hypothetical protein GGTG_03703 [Gaeumannomyces tritici R3-111a-1]EJT78604.1 hypothetical protein GGTG_03703 [Gaeumannomyces tritici R3-111a-1]
MASQDAPTKAKVAILSLGDMGSGIARLLAARGFPVATNCEGRSADTAERARTCGAALFKSDLELVDWADVVLSVVPPRDAAATLQRVLDAMAFSKTHAPAAAAAEGSGRPLYFADMNAVSPATCRRMAADVARTRVPLLFIDGCILGGPPAPKKGGEGRAEEKGEGEGDEWAVPLMPTSGPRSFASLGDALGGPLLESTLRARHISADVGAASGLKMCFASLSKGFSAIAVQTYTTAHRLGVLGDLEWALGELAPARARQAASAITSMPPKAYRWVHEMEEISDTHAADGGFDPFIFQGAAAVFRAVAQDTVLGQEKVGQRKRGLTVQDVAEAMSEGMDRKRKKTD